MRKKVELVAVMVASSLISVYLVVQFVGVTASGQPSEIVTSSIDGNYVLCVNKKSVVRLKKKCKLNEVKYELSDLFDAEDSDDSSESEVPSPKSYVSSNSALENAAESRITYLTTNGNECATSLNNTLHLLTTDSNITHEPEFTLSENKYKFNPVSYDLFLCTKYVYIHK